MKTLVTPEMAMKLLEKNGHNRKVAKAHVDKLAALIKANEFAYNGEPIIVGEDGTLLDGQHRLMAIVQAGKSVHTELIKDVPSICEHTGLEVFSTINAGKKRDGKDIISIMDKEAKPQQVNDVMKAMIAVDNMTVDRRSGMTLSNIDVQRFYDKRKDEIDRVIEETFLAFDGTVNKDIIAEKDVSLMIYALRNEPDPTKVWKFIVLLNKYQGDMDEVECEEYGEVLCNVVGHILSKLRAAKEMGVGGASLSSLKAKAMFKAYNQYTNDKMSRISVRKDMDYIYPRSMNS